MNKIALVLSLSFLSFGCASATPTQKGAAAGSVLGAGLGAIIGHQSGDAGKGALIGAAAGGLGGALIGDAAATQFCPTCGRDYTGGQTHCPLDGTALRQKGAPAQTAEQQAVQSELPKFCPACGRSYPASAGYCEADGTALKSRKQ